MGKDAEEEYYKYAITAALLYCNITLPGYGTIVYNRCAVITLWELGLLEGFVYQQSSTSSSTSDILVSVLRQKEPAPDAQTLCNR